MDEPRYYAGVDISTQTVSATLIGVREAEGIPEGVTVSRLVADSPSISPRPA